MLESQSEFLNELTKYLGLHIKLFLINIILDTL